MMRELELSNAEAAHALETLRGEAVDELQAVILRAARRIFPDERSALEARRAVLIARIEALDHAIAVLNAH